MLELTPEMIDRGAQKLREVQLDGVRKQPWDKLHPAHKELWLKHAKAVLYGALETVADLNPPLA